LDAATPTEKGPYPILNPILTVFEELNQYPSEYNQFGKLG